jgi:pyruvate,water dikinase
VTTPGDEGGKAAGLRRLSEAGFAVPRFLVVGRRIFDAALGPRRHELDTVLRSLDPEGPGAFERAAARAREIVAAAPWPAEFVADLARAVAEELDCGQGLAVRSSAPEEDTAAHSFAGVFDSCLAVRSDAVPAAIRLVWISAFSPRALAYRRRKHLDLLGITTAVVVQEMVPAVVSGVLFTRDPDDPDQLLVSAGLGLGEGVVAGTVETDTYRVARRGSRVVADVRRKEERVVASSGTGGTRRQDVPAEDRGEPALSPHQIRLLRRMGLEAESRLGQALDLEWAFDERGQLFVLQARPIVSRVPGARRVWDSANVVESYPGLTQPLTFSFARRAYEGTFRRAADGLLPWGNPFREQPEIFGHLIGLLEGRIYYNLLHWYTLFAVLPGSDRYREAWDRMLGIAHEAEAPAPQVGGGARVIALLCALSKLARPRALGAHFARRFASFYARHRNAASAVGPHALVAAYRELEREALGFWHLTLYNDFGALKHLQGLDALARRHGLVDVVPALLGGHDGDLESIAPLRSLTALVALVRGDPKSDALFRGHDDAAVWAALCTEPSYGHLREAFDRHLDAFGDRGASELKLETPTYREEPERLVALVRSWSGCAAGEGHAAGEEGAGVARRAAEVLVDALPISRLERGLWRFLVARARLCLRQRESMRLARTRLFGLVRRIFRRLGDELVAEGRLEDPRDVFYLSIDELEDVVEGASVTNDLSTLVRLRRAEYVRFAEHEPPSRLETRGIPGLTRAGASSGATPAPSLLRGIPSAPGRVVGEAALVHDPRGTGTPPGRILVTKTTDPGWIFLMATAAGLVTERGSLLSHTAIIGRELGIPTVVGVEGATTHIADGALVAMDGGTGEVTILPAEAARCG